MADTDGTIPLPDVPPGAAPGGEVELHGPKPRRTSGRRRAGEVLVDIDAPDLRQAVEQKEAVIVQREKELAATVADLAVAKNAVEAAEVAVKFKTLDIDRAKDVRAARKLDFDALAQLF